MHERIVVTLKLVLLLDALPEVELMPDHVYVSFMFIGESVSSR